MSTAPLEPSGVTYEPLAPSGTRSKVVSSTDVSRNLRLATIFFFMAFAFHTISMVTFSLGQDAYIHVSSWSNNNHDNIQSDYSFYTNHGWAGPVIGPLVTSYILGVVAFILMVLQQFDDLLKHNPMALFVTFGLMVLQCELSSLFYL